MTRGLATALLLVATPGWAQRTEISVVAGYTTAGDLEQKAPGIQELELDGAFTWGIRAGRFFTPQLGFEASWSRQESALVLGTPDGSAELFDLHVDQLLGHFVYQLGGEAARLRPFLSAGLGATFFSAHDLDGETKLAWSLGAGLKWFPSRRLGIRLEARYNPTHLNDASSDFCDPFGFCQGWLHQFEMTGGVVFRL